MANCTVTAQHQDVLVSVTLTVVIFFRGRWNFYV